VKEIFDIAQIKLGNEIDEPGEVHPRVLRGIIEEGSYNDDFLVKDYLAGVLASSRSKHGRDDSNLTILSVVNELSAYILRSHYVFYHIIKKLYNSSGIDPGIDRDKLMTFIPQDVFVVAMDISPDENGDLILENSLTHLNRVNLIEENWSAGDADFMKTQFSGADTAGFIIIPSLFGFELFSRAQGYSKISINDFLTEDIQFELKSEVIIGDGAKKVR